METIINILDLLLQPTVVLLVGILTIMFNNGSHKKDISLERLEKVYHPLFLKIEPNLYKRNIESNEINSFILNLIK